MAMPSASPTMIRARPSSSGFSAMAPIAALPTLATAKPAPSEESPVASAAAMNPHCRALSDSAVPAAPGLRGGGRQPPEQQGRRQTDGRSPSQPERRRLDA